MNSNHTQLTASYKTSEGEVIEMALILNKKFVDDKRDSIKIDFTRFIINSIMEKSEDENGRDADLLVIYPEDPIHPIHTKQMRKDI